jgi:hypothetical protein
LFFVLLNQLFFQIRFQLTFKSRALSFDVQHGRGLTWLKELNQLFGICVSKHILVELC